MERRYYENVYCVHGCGSAVGVRNKFRFIAYRKSGGARLAECKLIKSRQLKWRLNL
jgi:hypothetical protein